MGRLTLPAYLVASRQGIFLVRRDHWRQLVAGGFFGIVCVGEDVFAFRHDLPHAGALTGRIVRFAWERGELVEQAVLVSGLDRHCHQLDHFDGAFFLVDTHDQSIREYDLAWAPAGVHQILPPADPDGPDHAHVNSIMGDAETVRVMLHNKQRGMPSEIVEYDRMFRERRRMLLPCSSCHDIASLPDGRLLTCLSPRGVIRVLPGKGYKIDDYLTRGLAVSPDEIAVGSSLYGPRRTRAQLPGFVTFLDHDFRRTGRISVPAAPTQIRRLWFDPEA